jgi:NAD(P)H-nitrite reductase large subunit
VDISSARERLRAGLGLARLWPVAQEGLGYLLGLRRRRVPMLAGAGVVRILGESRVTGAVVAPVDATGRRRAGSERRFDVDTVCLGYGFVPSIELAAVRGCALEHAPARGGWIPRRSDALETTVRNVFAVGDCAGISGARVDLEEGRLAGLEVARRLGRLTPHEAARRIDAVRTGLRAFAPLRRYLETVYQPRPGLVELLDDAVTVCRCEDVTAGAIKDEIGRGARSLQEVKSATRVGMGYCQARMCTPAVTALLQRHAGADAEVAVAPSARPPVRPCTIDQLCDATAESEVTP